MSHDPLRRQMPIADAFGRDDLPTRIARGYASHGVAMPDARFADCPSETATEAEWDAAVDRTIAERRATAPVIVLDDEDADAPLVLVGCGDDARAIRPSDVADGDGSVVAWAAGLLVLGAGIAGVIYACVR